MQVRDTIARLRAGFDAAMDDPGVEEMATSAARLAVPEVLAREAAETAWQGRRREGARTMFRLRITMARLFAEAKCFAVTLGKHSLHTHSLLGNFRGPIAT